MKRSALNLSRYSHFVVFAQNRFPKYKVGIWWIAVWNWFIYMSAEEEPDFLFRNRIWIPKQGAYRKLRYYFQVCIDMPICLQLSDERFSPNIGATKEDLGKRRNILNFEQVQAQTIDNKRTVRAGKEKVVL